MTKRIQKPKTTQERKPETVTEQKKPEKTAEEIKAETDSLLDEIDEMLETNAEDFVKSYVQKGGE